MCGSCKIELAGEVITEPRVIARYGLEDILEVLVRYVTDSGAVSRFTVNYPCSLDFDVAVGDFVHLIGDIRSNRVKKAEDSLVSLLKLYIFTTSIEKADDLLGYYNNVQLEGVKVKSKADVRKSYADDSVMVSNFAIGSVRKPNRINYIPVSAWGRLAVLTRKLQVGDIVSGLGRAVCKTTRNGYEMFEVSLRELTLDEPLEMK